MRLLRYMVECQQQACWVSPLQVQHIYSVHAACLALVLGDSSWIERLLTANTQKTGQNYIISEWDPNCVLSFSPRWDVQAYSPPATCAVESARNLSLSRATVLISISSAERPTHILRSIWDISYVIGHSLILHYLLPFKPRVCPVRDHNQCHIPFERLRAQNEQPSEGKPEKSVYGSRLTVQQ